MSETDANHRPTSDICNVQESTSLSHIQYSAMHLSDINIQSFIYRWHIQYLPINMYLRYPTPALTHPISNHSPVSDKSSIRPFTYRRNIQYLIVHVWMFTSSGCLLVWMFTSSGCLLVWMFTSSGCLLVWMFTSSFKLWTREKTGMCLRPTEHMRHHLWHC
jgi:hypothetical protein